MLNRHAALLVLGLTMVGGVGCGYREPLYASPTVVDDRVLVRVTDAHARGDRVRVSAWLVNQTDRSISLDRGAIGLRLPDGRVLPSAGRAKPFRLAPGQGKTVKVDFRARGEQLDLLPNAFLVVEGGEIELSPAYAVATRAPVKARSEDAERLETDETDESAEGDASGDVVVVEPTEVDTWFEP